MTREERRDMVSRITAAFTCAEVLDMLPDDDLQELYNSCDDVMGWSEDDES